MKINNLFWNSLKPDRRDVTLWLILSVALTAAVALEHNIVVAVLLGIMLSSYVMSLFFLARIILGCMLVFLCLKTNPKKDDDDFKATDK